MRFSRSLQLKISLFLVLCMFLSYSLPVKAAVFPDVNDIIAEWDPNISTSFRDVYNEYKSLAPADRDTADRVIAANAYRYLLSIGSNVLGMTVINEQRFSDFMRAVSPFNMAFNNVIAEYLILAAWSMSGDQYKIFCANVIHNIAINSEYYNSHVIKNDPFIDEAAQGSIQFSYNDIDNNHYFSVYNNIFLGNVLTSTGGSVGAWFNPNPLYYTGRPIYLSELTNFLVNKPSTCDSFCVFSYRLTNFSGSPYAPYLNYLYCYNIVDIPFGFNTRSDTDSLYFYCTVNSSNTATLSLYQYSFGRDYASLQFNLINYLDPVFNNFSFSSHYGFPSVSFTFSDLSNLKDRIYAYFNQYVSDYLVYASDIFLYLNIDNTNYYTLSFPFPTGTSFISPQFQPVNIYNNQVYTSSEDTYWYVDQMIDNINNYDYSTNNNGTNNTFYIDNYYITEAASGGGVQLTTSASITYQYITINNITTGPSIGSGPFDVRIINPEDITSEIITNSNSQIINDYDFKLGDLNLKVSVGNGLSSIASNLDPVVSSGSGIVADFFGGIPPDIATVVFSLLALSIIAGVFYRVTSG